MCNNLLHKWLIRLGLGVYQPAHTRMRGEGDGMPSLKQSERRGKEHSAVTRAAANAHRRRTKQPTAARRMKSRPPHMSPCWGRDRFPPMIPHTGVLPRLFASLSTIQGISARWAGRERISCLRPTETGKQSRTCMLPWPPSGQSKTASP